MLKDDCLFCRIVKGELPSNTIYEDDDFKVILDIGPVTKGHALIIPKDHFSDMYEIPEERAAAAIGLAKRLMIKMTDRLGCDGFNILQNNKEAAEQTVPHFHIHLIPRYSGQRKLFGFGSLEFTPEEFAKIAEEIRG